MSSATYSPTAIVMAAHVSTSSTSPATGTRSSGTASRATQDAVTTAVLPVACRAGEIILVAARGRTASRTRHMARAAGRYASPRRNVMVGTTAGSATSA